MIRKMENKDTKTIKRLFGDWEETMIWSCLQGVMGEVFVAEVRGANEPKAAVAVLGAFAFFAGEPDRELLLYKPERYPGEFVIMVS